LTSAGPFCNGVRHEKRLVATNHSVATGTVVDMATGYPGYNSVIPREAAAIGEILRQHGYDTSWYGGARGLEANHRGRPAGWRLAANFAPPGGPIGRDTTRLVI